MNIKLKAFGAVCGLLAFGGQAFGHSFCPAPASTTPAHWTNTILMGISYFETSRSDGYGRIARDFDCNGISAGVLQWNLRHGTLQPILRQLDELDPKLVKAKLGPYYQSFEKTIVESRSTRSQLNWARGFQSYKNPRTCGADRGAKWTKTGLSFSSRLSELLETPLSRLVQNISFGLRLSEGHACATWWKGDAIHDAGFIDTAFFTDLLNTHGHWWMHDITPEAVNNYISKHGGTTQALETVLKFLESRVAVQQLQVPEAKANSRLWRRMLKDGRLREQDMKLVILAYLVARHDARPNFAALQFVTIGRSGVLAFGKGYVNGHEEPIIFPMN